MRKRTILIAALFTLLAASCDNGDSHGPSDTGCGSMMGLAPCPVQASSQSEAARG